MADKETKLSIVIRTVDQATAKIKAINERLDAATKPIRNFKQALGDLREKSGLDDVIGGFKGVGSAIGDLLGKVALVGGVVGLATAGLIHLVDQFDDLGKKAARLGVSVDFLASMRYAAEKTGVPLEALDEGLQAFNQNLGQARAGTGRMAKFLNLVSPALLKQVKAAKDNAEAFDLIAGAMAKIEDPAKRAALAQKTLGDSALAPLFARGPKGLKELRDRYIQLAGSQEGATEEAEKAGDAMHDFHAATDGVKAALVQGLAPALTVIVAKLRDWLSGHRDDIREWAKQLGEKLPAAFNALVGAFSTVIDVVRPFVDSSTKLKIIAVALAAIIAGPLVASVYSLGVALLTTPVGWITAGLAAIAIGAYEIINNWDELSAFFVDLWDTIKHKFAWAIPIIQTITYPFVGLPLQILAVWGDIKDFFSNLWDDVTGVFRKAWDIISGIVDKITGAVDSVKSAASDVIDFLNPFSSSDEGLSAGTLAGSLAQKFQNQILGAQLALQGGSSQAKITVDFANAPRGTRVTTDPQSTADVDLGVGYQMGFAP